MKTKISLLMIFCCYTFISISAGDDGVVIESVEKHKKTNSIDGFWEEMNSYRLAKGENKTFCGPEELAIKFFKLCHKNKNEKSKKQISPRN